MAVFQPLDNILHHFLCMVTVSLVWPSTVSCQIQATKLPCFQTKSLSRVSVHRGIVIFDWALVFEYELYQLWSEKSGKILPFVSLVTCFLTFSARRITSCCTVPWRVCAAREAFPASVIRGSATAKTTTRPPFQPYGTPSSKRSTVPSAATRTWPYDPSLTSPSPFSHPVLRQGCDVKPRSMLSPSTHKLC